MNAPLPAPSPPRRLLRKCFFGLAATIVILVAAAPTLFSSIPALRVWLVRTVVGPLNGEVSVARLDVGWFRSLVLTDVKLTPTAGEPALTIDRIESERPLWQMVVSPADMGTIRIERPVAYLEFHEKGTNWSELFRKPPTADVTSKPRTKLPLDVGVRAQVVNGVLRGRSLHTGENWQIDQLNIALGLRAAARSQSGKQELFVEAGKPVDHREISAGLCNDVLKYAAPAVANVAEAQGQITIELDDWRLPIEDPAAGELSGRLTMHTVEVGPGPLVRSILAPFSALLQRLELPSAVQLARESTIPFKLIDRRIYHENMRFSLAGLADIATSGYVGFDESLELTTQLGFHPPNPESRYLAALRVLTTQPWPIKIGGKLGAPVIDASPLKAAGVDLASKWASDIEAGNNSLGAQAFQALNDAGIPLEPNDVRKLMQLLQSATSQTGANSPTPGTASPPIDGGQLALDILRTLAQRREAMRQQQQSTPPQPGLPPSAVPPEPLPRRPLLRQGLRMLLTPPPPPTGTAAPPPPPNPNLP